MTEYFLILDMAFGAIIIIIVVIIIVVIIIIIISSSSSSSSILQEGSITLENRLVLEWRSISLYYSDVIMSAMASQITSLPIVYSTVYSGADQRKHQSSASLAIVTGEFPAQMARNAENVSIQWRHHEPIMTHSLHQYVSSKAPKRFPCQWWIIPT